MAGRAVMMETFGRYAAGAEDPRRAGATPDHPQLTPCDRVHNSNTARAAGMLLGDELSTESSMLGFSPHRDSGEFHYAEIFVSATLVSNYSETTSSRFQ